MAILNENIYLGTTWGCIIIAEKSTLRPITIFRPFEEEVKAIVPFNNAKFNADDSGPQSNTKPLIATVGRGYRNLVSRYVDTVHLGPASAGGLQQFAKNIFVLLWRAEHWNTN